MVPREALSVVWLRGEHDLSTVGPLSEILARAIASGHGDLVVDLSEVQFMAAATVGVLRRARQLLGVQSRSLALRSPSRRARRVIELCGDADLIQIRVSVRPTYHLDQVTAATAAGVKVP
jgi:anti-anti-sigma factor